MNIGHILLILSFVKLCVSTTTQCNLRETKNGSVCVCTESYCDYLEEPKLTHANDVWIVSSSKHGLRFATKIGVFNSTEMFTVRNYDDPIDEGEFDPAVLIVDNQEAILEYSTGKTFSYFWPSSTVTSVWIDRNVQFQNVTGFGGAFTGSVSYVLSQLSQNLQNHVYRSYYHKDGIAFNTMRMSIGGCDFDLEPWAYLDQTPGDTLLQNFTQLDVRDQRKVKQIKHLKQIAEIDRIKIMAAAWSAPRWMKSNTDWTGFGFLKPEYYQSWANYHLKFLELMNAADLPIWAISTGNEPMNAVYGIVVRFMSLGWLPKDMAVWLSEHLGPTIRNSSLKDTLIFGNDDQRYTFPAYFRKMKQTRSNALDYLDGLAVHWYTDFFIAPNLIDITHAAMPDKMIINTESCLGSTPILDARGAVLGSWERGEQYMHGFIENFQHHYNGWIDWNLILDEQGGPNYVQNYVDSPIIANITNRSEIYKQPIFFAIGHFSKFIPEGSVRIQVEFTHLNLESVAFKRPDGKIAVVLFNNGNTILNVSLNDSVRGKIVLLVPARSFHTIVYN